MKLSMITCTGTGTIGGYTVTKETTMKQIDTAQLDITACQAQAAEYHARGFNCAQAVACTLAPAVGLDPQVAFTLTEGFGAGMGGMTETCGPVCVSLPEDNRIGTIGMPICGITAGIAEDGELVIKGPLVCKGYHNNPGVTAQQITDGWLHTGDLGDISEDGFISITGRKKDLIITAGGKNVSPGLLEASVMTSPVVNQCLVIGDKKPFVAALVTLDLADANKWLESQGAKPEPDLASLAKNAIVHAEVERAVNAANEGVSRAESIRKFEILPDEFTEANGMLTPSLKTRRAQIVEHYRELIDDVIYVPLKK